MTGIDPAKVAAQITGCVRIAAGGAPLISTGKPVYFCDKHGSGWTDAPCPVFAQAVEITRAALEKAWDEGWNDGREQWSDGEFVHALTDNPYAKEGVQ